MIRVYQVVSDTNVGGAGRYLLNYIRYFDRDKYDVTVLLPENSALKKLLEKFADISIIEVPYMADKSYDKRCVKFLSELFRKEKIDIIHTHASLSARIAAKKAKIRTVISTRHCIEPIGSFPVGTIKSLLNNCLCDYYIAVSDAVKTNLLASGIHKNKIRIVTNGVEAVEQLSENKLSELKEKYNVKDETVFGIFARLEPVKGHCYFIEAAKRFLSEGCKGKFLIVGDGSLEKDLKEQADGFPEIIFTGYVTDTTELLNLTDVNVLASQSEAMSLAILEAMSLGKPTIATDVGGNGQLIRRDINGILTPYGDAEAMKYAFIKMSEDKAYYDICAENAGAIYRETYTAKEMVKNLERLYEEVANEN